MKYNGIDEIYLRSSKNYTISNKKNLNVNSDLLKKIRKMLVRITLFVSLVASVTSFKKEKDVLMQTSGYEIEKEDQLESIVEDTRKYQYIEQTKKILENSNNIYDMGTKTVNGVEEKIFGYNHKNIANDLFNRGEAQINKGEPHDFHIFFITMFMENPFLKESDMNKILEYLPDNYTKGAKDFKEFMEFSGYSLNEMTWNEIKEDIYFKIIHIYMKPLESEGRHL